MNSLHILFEHHIEICLRMVFSFNFQSVSLWCHFFFQIIKTCQDAFLYLFSFTKLIVFKLSYLSDCLAVDYDVSVKVSCRPGHDLS